MALSLLPDQGSIRAKLQGRSFWRLRYMDGRVVNEWDCDWSLAPLNHRQALRLHCPNGNVAEFGVSQGATGRLFQFKGGLLMGGDRNPFVYHVIGMIDGLDGECSCAAWEYEAQRLVMFRDNFFHMQYGQAGALSADVLGVRI